MKINERLLGLVVVGVIGLGILGASAAGLWSTENDKTPSKLTEAGVEGEYNPEDIRGSYTFKEISELYKIDLIVLKEAFQVPEDRNIETFKSKDIEGLYESTGSEIGNGSLKVFVALYKNLPIYLGDDMLPETAVALIKENNVSLTPEAIAYLETHTLGVLPINNPLETVEVAPAVKTTPQTPHPTSDSETENEPVVNGQSTFQSALDLGITKEQIEVVIGASMPPTNQSIRDYCKSNGLQFSEIKAKLLELVE